MIFGHESSFIPTLAVAIIWRIISYYPYLIIGASIVPGWIQKKFVKSRTKKK